MGEINILMTGAGAPGAPGIIKCIQQDKRFNIHLCDSNQFAVGQFLSKSKFYVIPKADDPDFIDKIINICTTNSISVILPLVTKELFVFAKYKKKLKSLSINVMVSESDALNIANDKGKLYNFLQDKGSFLPKYSIALKYDDFIKGIEKLNFPDLPVCIKPSVSNGSRGFRIINNNINEKDLLFNYKPDSTVVNFSVIEHILRDNTFPELLVCEYLPGAEYSVDCVANNGEMTIAIPRIRTKIIGGISVEGQIVKNEEIIKMSMDIINLLKLHGNIGIQFKLSINNEIKLLEINPRVQGTIVTAFGAGVNMPLIAIKQELGMEITEEELSVKWGTRFIRYWNEVYF
jgi:carbamoyl-phosphate synthase large subunit